jgi:hypothetical protein
LKFGLSLLGLDWKGAWVDLGYGWQLDTFGSQDFSILEQNLSMSAPHGILCEIHEVTKNSDIFAVLWTFSKSPFYGFYLFYGFTSLTY